MNIAQALVNELATARALLTRYEQDAFRAQLAESNARAALSVAEAEREAASGETLALKQQLRTHRILLAAATAWAVTSTLYALLSPG